MSQRLADKLQSSVGVLIAALVATATAISAFAQTPAKNQAPAPKTQAPAAKSQAPAQPAKPSTAESDELDEEPATADSSNPMFSGFMDPFDYDQRGRRDPFVMPVPDRPAEQGSIRGPLLPLQKFDLSQLRLVGIIWDVKHPKAMIKDPSGATHVVGTNTKVGPRNGYIAVIREGEMVVVETQEQEGKLVSSAQVVKIAR